MAKPADNPGAFNSAFDRGTFRGLPENTQEILSGQLEDLPLPAQANLERLLGDNEAVFFSGWTSETGNEVWTLDDTAPVLLADVNVGTAGSDPREFTLLDGDLYFTATTEENGSELYKLDGSTGELTLFDINPTGGSNPTGLTAYNGDLYFIATGVNPEDGTDVGRELYKIDGETGAVTVFDYVAGTGSTSPANLTVFNGDLYFTGIDPVKGTELMKIDATDQITVKDVNDGFGGIASSSPADLTVFDGDLYFKATTTNSDGISTGQELVRLDGETGAIDVFDINPGISSSLPTELTEWNGALYFKATTPETGLELFKFDPTTDTWTAIDINQGTVGSFPSDFFVFNNDLYFKAFTEETGFELFKLDDTTGLVSAIDINPGTGSSNPGHFTAFGGDLYFTANNEVQMLDGATGDVLQFEDLLQTDTGYEEWSIVGATGDMLYLNGTDTDNADAFGLFGYDGMTVTLLEPGLTADDFTVIPENFALI